MSVTIDPRAASSRVLAGPTDLVGEEIVPIDVVEVDGVAVGVPRLMPGAAEWATVSAAETAADAYREAALGQLDRRGQIPCLDISAAVNFRLNAGTAVASAAVGLEAYANFHLDRVAGEAAGAAADRPLNERYGEELPAIFQVDPPTQESWWPAFRRVQTLAALQRHAIEQPVSKRGRSLNSENRIAISPFPDIEELHRRLPLDSEIYANAASPPRPESGGERGDSDGLAPHLLRPRGRSIRRGGRCSDSTDLS